jgi:hypothetical protein
VEHEFERLEVGMLLDAEIESEGEGDNVELCGRG